ncbi:hypothetical protein Purlil1_13746 [Purpureocillium lilacinum]|uniref:Uncharacterized protein n=1 Tax=Purpureocillium lilacinum TaxID=33203 RepID=A0ABR0BD69_PURLI|nr:hypothetical protein Purlil1_13746 [Purpureocillium lilacinum]
MTTGPTWPVQHQSDFPLETSNLDQDRADSHMQMGVTAQSEFIDGVLASAKADNVPTASLERLRQCLDLAPSFAMVHHFVKLKGQFESGGDSEAFQSRLAELCLDLKRQVEFIRALQGLSRHERQYCALVECINVFEVCRIRRDIESSFGSDQLVPCLTCKELICETISGLGFGKADGMILEELQRQKSKFEPQSQCRRAETSSG